MPYKLLTRTGFSVIGVLSGCSLKSIVQNGKWSIRLGPPTKKCAASRQSGEGNSITLTVLLCDGSKEKMKGAVGLN